MQKPNRTSNDNEVYIRNAVDKINMVDGSIHSFLPEPGRLSRLLSENTKRKKGDKKPLHNLLVGVKDIFRVNGLPIQAGSRLPPHLFVGKESSVVTALRNADAIILGKTVSTEFAAGQPAETVNPINHAYTPGGSSSGSAAAVAAGLCDLGIGSQTIGSTLRPASYCGIVGYKPTFGRISIDGSVSYSPSLDTIGLFTRTMDELMPITQVLLETELLSDKQQSAPVFGIPDGPYMTQPEKEVQNVFQKTMIKLQHDGYQVKRIPLLPDIEQINDDLWTVAMYEMAHIHKENGWYPTYRDLYGPITIDLIEKGLQIDTKHYQNARDKQKLLRNTIEETMMQNGIDAWLSPSTLDYAPKTLTTTGKPTMNIPWTFAGLPSLSLPMKKSGHKMPLGLQIVTTFMQDEKLLEIGHLLERIIS